MEATEGHADAAQAAGAPPLPTLTVAAVARRLGVAPPTLRTWDRRYGLGPSAHTAGAHRRYSPGDVARLMVMRRLTLQGVPPADAARIALASSATADEAQLASITPFGQRSAADLDDPMRSRRGGPGSEEPATPSAGLYVDPESEDVADSFSDADLRDARQAGADELDGDGLDGPWREEPGAKIETPWLGVLRSARQDQAPSGGGRVVALPEGTPATRGLARAAMSLDTLHTGRVLREAIRRGGVVSTWDRIVVPVLQALGERTGATGDGIDVEHAFSETLLGVLRGIALGVRHPRNPAPVLLVCAEDDHHTLPLHALAAALAERDVGCRMLGPGMPPHALASAVRRSGPCAVVVHAQMPGADGGATEDLRRQRPAPRIVLAGSGWRTDTIPASVRTAASLGEAVDEVLLAVHA